MPRDNTVQKLDDADVSGLLPGIVLPESSVKRSMAALLHELQQSDDDGPLIAQRPDTTPSRLLNFFILSDATALLIAFLTAGAAAYFANWLILDRNLFRIQSLSLPAILAQFTVIGGGTLLWFGYSGHYQSRMPFWTEVRKVAEAMVLAMLIGCFVQFAGKEDFSRLWVIADCVCAVFATIGMRAVCRNLLSKQGLWEIPVLVLGNGLTANETCTALLAEVNLGYRIAGRIKDIGLAFRVSQGSWRRVCDMHGAQHVIVALDGEDLARSRAALAQLTREHIPFSIAPPMQNLSVANVVPQSFLGREVILLERNRGLERPLHQWMKRGFDIAVAGTALLVLGPFFAILAAVIKSDGGPAFYRHKRIGLNGETFSCLKLRSMAANADLLLKQHLEKSETARAEWAEDHKLRVDPRVTPLGAFLRRSSLDELPQLLNVLRGEMSLVGPRPIIVAETVKYDSDIAYYYRVRPGITGLWQVSGRNDVSYQERVRMDSWYVRNWSLWNDVAILCKTFGVVLKGSGAY